MEDSGVDIDRIIVTLKQEVDKINSSLIERDRQLKNTRDVAIGLLKDITDIRIDVKALSKKTESIEKRLFTGDGKTVSVTSDIEVIKQCLESINQDVRDWDERFSFQEKVLSETRIQSSTSAAKWTAVGMVTAAAVASVTSSLVGVRENDFMRGLCNHFTSEGKSTPAICVKVLNN